MLVQSIPCHDHLQEPACPRGVRWSGGAGVEESRGKTGRRTWPSHGKTPVSESLA